MAQQTATVRVKFLRDGETPSHELEYPNSAGISFDANTGVLTVVSGLSRPRAMFLLTPNVVVEIDENMVVTPQLLTNGIN